MARKPTAKNSDCINRTSSRGVGFANRLASQIFPQ
jgi:hypothetical protein